MRIKENELCSDLQSGHVPDKPHLMKSLKEIAQATLPAAKQQKGWPLPPVKGGWLIKGVCARERDCALYVEAMQLNDTYAMTWLGSIRANHI